MPTLREHIQAWWPEARARAAAVTVRPMIEEVGTVARVGDGVATVLGLPHTRHSELLRFRHDVLGVAISLARGHLGAILLGDDTGVRAGSRVRGTGAVARVPVGPALLGRVVDALGRPLDGKPAITPERHDPIEQPAPSIMARERVTRPLETGILVIDAMLPLGRGQRELIVGDRATGKTAIAVDAVIHQRTTDVICIYTFIGQKSSTVKGAIDAVRTYGAAERCVFVVAEADSPPGLQWLTPYAACTMAEYFRDRGQDVLIVFDDLSKHAAVYRQLSLLLRVPPGREAFPGDIFYLHSRLLERAAQLHARHGGGSLTALPICQTQGGNLTAYIPTNLVSITDGQIVCEPKLFHEGQKPAVNVGLSVSRIGGRTQAPAMREVAQRLRLTYTQYLELEVFTRFGGMVEERSRELIEHGRRIRALLRQPQFQPLPRAIEIALLLSLEQRLFAELSPAEISAARADLAAALERALPEVLDRIRATGELTDDDRNALIQVIRNDVQERVARRQAGSHAENQATSEATRPD